jgi:hypothetical protein
MRLHAQASLAILVILTIVIVVISFTVSETSYKQYIGQSEAISEAQAFTLSDSGIELALLELYRNGGYSGGVLATPLGEITINITSSGGDQRDLSSITIYNDIRRQISAELTVTQETHPLEDISAFGGDDILIQASNALVVGDIWSNDNIRVQNGGEVQGDIRSSGAGSSSNTLVRDSGSTVQGNIWAIDEIRVTNSGTVTGVATSADEVIVNTGGSVGSSVEDPNLTIASVVIPAFNFDVYEAQAQADGTYYSSPSQFTNFLGLNGNTVSGGVHFIDSNSPLTLSSSTAYNITGSIISRGDINISAPSYTHVAENNLPALATLRTLSVVRNTSCACNVAVTGVIFAERNINLDYNNHTGGGFAVNITGGAWAGDDAIVADNSRLIADLDILANVLGFSFDGGGGTNSVEVLNWGIQ